MKINGGCHCGDICYTAIVKPNKVIVCHCADCQLLSASAFRTVVMSEPDSLTFTKGKPKEYIKVAESGNQRAQGFCENCGSGIYATSVGDEAKIYGIRLGTVSQKAQLKPKAQIWCRSAQTWLNELSTIPAHQKGPN